MKLTRYFPKSTRTCKIRLVEILKVLQVEEEDDDDEEEAEENFDDGDDKRSNVVSL